MTETEDPTKHHYFKWDGVTPRPPAKKKCVCGLRIDDEIHPHEYIKTAQFQAQCKDAEDKRLDKVMKLLEDEGEPFLELVKMRIQEVLDECYSYGD